MIKQTFKDIYTDELAEGAILNTEYHGFREDYLILHCLLRKYQPKSVWEYGCNMGTGTKIICNAVPKAKVYSFDLPTELAHVSLQHPISEGKGDSVGHKCDLPFELIRGDSLTFDLSGYPCDAYYVDGEHDYEHPYRETINLLQHNPKLVIYHDSDIQEVYNAIVDGFKGRDDYELFRVTDTRIAYAVRK